MATGELAAVVEAQRFPAIVKALGNPNFRLFWSGNFLSNIGTWMQNVAAGLAGADPDVNSAFWLGIVGFAGSIPFLFFTLFGGVIADRVNKRRLLIVTQTVMMLLAFLLAALVYWKGDHGLGGDGNRLPERVGAGDEPAQLPGAGAATGKARRPDQCHCAERRAVQFIQGAGAIAGRLRDGAMGVAGNFFLNGLSFLAVLFALVKIEYQKERRGHHESMMRSLRAGLRYVRGNPQMYVLTWMIGIASLMAMGFLTFIPYFARTSCMWARAGWAG